MNLCCHRELKRKKSFLNLLYKRLKKNFKNNKDEQLVVNSFKKIKLEIQKISSPVRGVSLNALKQGKD